MHLYICFMRIRCVLIVILELFIYIPMLIIFIVYMVILCNIIDLFEHLYYLPGHHTIAFLMITTTLHLVMEVGLR